MGSSRMVTPHALHFMHHASPCPVVGIAAGESTWVRAVGVAAGLALRRAVGGMWVRGDGPAVTVAVAAGTTAWTGVTAGCEHGGGRRGEALSRHPQISSV